MTLTKNSFNHLNKLKLSYSKTRIYIACRPNCSGVALGLFLLLLIAQAWLWIETERLKPSIGIVPELPSKYALEALSLGDKAFYFRVLALEIQNAGDSFGRFTALKNYDYSKLYQWFKILDSLDERSKFIPALASYYYSQTQNYKDSIYLVKYLSEYSLKDINENWWWLYQAVYMAYFTLKDYDLALDLAYKLSTNTSSEAPFWTKQLPAFFHAQLGQDCSAFLIIKHILDEDKTGARKLTAEEISFMKHFIKKRLKELKRKNFDPRQCQNI